jgi:23S rRNA (guanosine2251-2'-O)-methyltransferase
MKNELGHYIYGRRAVNEALNAGRLIEKIFIQFGSDGDIIEEIRTKARQKNVACSIADKMKFNDMEKRIPLERGSAQGVIALTPLLTYSDIYELIDTSLASQNYPMLLGFFYLWLHTLLSPFFL